MKEVKYEKTLGLMPNFPYKPSIKNIKKNISKYFSSIEIKDLYKENAQGLRSDDFKKNHDGLHILFAGCSVTYGEGLFLEQTWSHKVYKEISKNKKVSGYYNVGISGGTYFEILSQIFKYIEEYGNPDIIFINFPDPQREYSYLFKNGSVFSKPKWFNNFNRDRVNMHMVTLYRSLVSYCKKQKIELYSFSWDPIHKFNSLYSLDPRKYFHNFYEINKKEESLHVYNFCEKNNGSPLERFFIKAMDEIHEGIAYHDFYFNFIYDIYRKDLKS